MNEQQGMFKSPAYAGLFVLGVDLSVSACELQRVFAA